MLSYTSMNIHEYGRIIGKKFKERKILFLYTAAGVLVLAALGFLGYFILKKNTYKAVAEEFKFSFDEKKEEKNCGVRRYTRRR